LVSEHRFKCLARKIQQQISIKKEITRMARNFDASEQGTQIPFFGGDDALGWTQQVERYYLMKGVSEEEKMQASMEALEGKALSWFRWWNRCNPNPSWEGFKIAVVKRFQPSMMQNPFEVLLSLKQTGTVKDYAMEFEKYVRALREINPEFVKGIFLKGLREEIQMKVRSNDPYSLSEIIQQAILKDQEREEWGVPILLGGNIIKYRDKTYMQYTSHMTRI
jgi:hypothetical protein